MSATERDAVRREQASRRAAVDAFQKRTARMSLSDKADVARREANAADARAEELIGEWEKTPDGIAAIGMEKRLAARDAATAAARAAAIAQEVQRCADLKARVPERALALAERLGIRRPAPAGGAD